jgi:glycerophosphoryl diester phosphodiesterase
MRRTISTALLCAAIMSAAASSIQVHGHRGARSVLPENSIPAFEHAIRAGTDAIELDLVVTKDNVLIVTHDPTVNESLCSGPHKGPYRQLTLAQVRELDCGSKADPAFPKQKAVGGTRIPTLDDVLGLGKGNRVLFNIEIKSFPGKAYLTPAPDEYAKLVLDAIRRHRMEKRSMVQSFDYRVLHAMKRIAPEIPLNALFFNDTREFAEIARDAGVATVAPHYSLVTKEKASRAHAAGIKVIPWTANTRDLWKNLLDAGVDGIITDDPAELISFLQSR